MAVLLVLSACAQSLTTGQETTSGLSAPSPEPASQVLGAAAAAPSTTTTTTTTSTTTSVPPTTTTEVPCTAPVPQFETPPAAVTAALEAAAAHPALARVDLSVSVWVEGWGEVLAVNPNLELSPASNQKLLVAIGAYSLLDTSASLSTTVEQVDDALVVRAGGDPSLEIAHVDALVRQVAESGVQSAERLIIDVSQYPQGPIASGWLDWQIPRFVGPLSGWMIDSNRWTQAPEFLTDPTLVNGERMADLFAASGIEVGTVEVGNAPPGTVLAEHLSPPISQLVRRMLLASDNQHADLIMMELGRVASGEGSLASGAEAVEEIIEELCVDAPGMSDDGSGLSRDNHRSARGFQELLRTLDDEMAAQLRTDLPVGGQSGTLASRFRADVGRVQAKTGTILDGRALSGYATTDGGREVIFSVIVNGEREAASASLGAIDQLVTAVLRLQG